MSNTRLWISAAIIALIILVIFTFSVPRISDVGVELPPQAETNGVPLVVLNSSFKNGLHTISGSIEAPNACTAVSAHAITVGNESSEQSILVAISMQPDSGVCLQVPTQTSFETTILAPANLPITVTVNGSPATTTSS